jgi:molybdopterin/thiamine biosynthesis adenylyltransferase
MDWLDTVEFKTEIKTLDKLLKFLAHCRKELERNKHLVTAETIFEYAESHCVDYFLARGESYNNALRYRRFFEYLNSVILP